MTQVKNMGMLSVGALVNVSWQWYLPAGSLETNPYLMKFMLTVWEKNQQEMEFTCVAKRKRYVLVSTR